MNALKTQHPQFAHLGHSAQVSKGGRYGKDKVHSTRGILDEASRVPSASRHIKNPLPPNWIMGSRELVEAREVEWRAQARESARGGSRRLSRTSSALACAVISWPRERQSEWVSYREAVIKYFTQKYGSRVTGAVEHTDESHQHIHIYMTPLNGEDFGAVHPGILARRIAARLPGNHTRIAYKVAMMQWQDDLFIKTGEPFGLTRYGTNRERMTRVETIARNRAKEIIEEAEAASASTLRKAAAAAASAKEEADRQAAEAKQLAMQAEIIQRMRESIERASESDKANEIDTLKAKIATLEAEIAKREKADDEQLTRERFAAEELARRNQSFAQTQRPGTLISEQKRQAPKPTGS